MLAATLKESEHSHPDPITFWPSGFNVNYFDETNSFNYNFGLPTGDIRRARENPNTDFYLYAPNYSKGPLRIQYNGQEIISIKNERKK